MIYLIVVLNMYSPFRGNTQIYNVGKDITLEVCDAIADGLRVEDRIKEVYCYEIQ